VDEFGKRKPPEGKSDATDSERRRIGLIVHDERGLASLEWRDAPADEQRTVLEVLGGAPRLEVQNDQSYDPYSHHTATLPKLNSGSTSRTDLRKLSEWIKMKRALEERKLRGDADDES
jgi:hypothetical protein